MPQARKRTTENRLTGTVGSTRRAVNDARFGGLVSEHADSRRASVYRSDVPHAAEGRRDEPRREITDAERVKLTERVRHLYCGLGWSVLDISIDVNHSAAFVQRIIKVNEFVKGKKEK